MTASKFRMGSHHPIDDELYHYALTSLPTSAPAVASIDYLPGLVIFVHGVNSEGEWYEQTEEGLINGLNKRLGRDRSPSGDALLRKVQYKSELLPDGKVDKSTDGETFITDHGRSPVIRFRWGYRLAGEDQTEGSIDERTEYAGNIYLDELEAWGGGPFQNATTALPYMWDKGLDERVFWWFYLNMFPVEARRIYGCPSRTYYVHAADRLKELIRLIRDKQPDCPITVICHSQGTAVAIAAGLMGKDEDALADTYIVSNSPLSLETSFMDKLSNLDRRHYPDPAGQSGEDGGVTSEARQKTFANFVTAVAQRFSDAPHQSLESINNKQSCTVACTREDGSLDPSGARRDLFKLMPLGPATDQPIEVNYDAGEDRDNRGRVFVYCNPHDQVVGASPVQGIGWKGIDAKTFKTLNAQANLHLRVWAQPKREGEKLFRVGCEKWSEYRYWEDHHSERFWNPQSPAIRYAFVNNKSASFISKLINTVTGGFVWLITNIVPVARVNKDPDKGWKVPINAPTVPKPIAPASTKAANTRADTDKGGYKDHQSGDFDEGADPQSDPLDKDDDWGAEYGDYERRGDAKSQAELRRQIEATIRMDRAGGRMTSEDSVRKVTTEFLNANPNATDHSTILTNPMHSEMVVAYDVAIGWVNPSRIKPSDLLSFRQFADWRYSAQSQIDTEEFFTYHPQGLFKDHQLKFTYTPDTMPASVINERKGIAG